LSHFSFVQFKMVSAAVWSAVIQASLAVQKSMKCSEQSPS